MVDTTKPGPNGVALKIKDLGDGTFAPAVVSVGASAGAGTDAIGTTTDAAATSGTGGTWTVASLLRGIFNALLGGTPGYGFAAVAAATFTRPADAVQYAIGDSMNATIADGVTGVTFPAVLRAAGKRSLLTDFIITSSADPAAGTLQGELWLFNAALATYDGDNKPYTMSAADMGKYIGKIPFVLESNTLPGGTGGSSCHVPNLGMIVNAPTGVAVFGAIKLKNAYTPVSGEIITMRLKAIQLD